MIGFESVKQNQRVTILYESGNKIAWTWVLLFIGGVQTLSTCRVVLPEQAVFLCFKVWVWVYVASVLPVILDLKSNFRLNNRQNRGKIHSQKNVVCYRKDNPVCMEFLPFPCVFVLAFVAKIITSYWLRMATILDYKKMQLDVGNEPYLSQQKICYSFADMNFS